jgi:hypothetical protein
MRFRLGRGRRAKTVEAVEAAAPAGAAPDPAVAPEPAAAPTETAVELSVEKLDLALERLRTEIPAMDDDASR